MSGLEVAGLAFGVVPIFLEVIKGYRATRETLHSFSSFSTALKRLQVRVNTQEALFRNECRLVLRLALGDMQGSEMLRDPLHQLWNDSNVEKSLSMTFGESYGTLEENLTEIQERLQEINDGVLEHFHPVPPTALHPDTSTELFSQFRQKLKFASSEEKTFKRKIDEVRNIIKDVSQLRSQVYGFHEHKPFTSSACIIRQKIPETFAAVREASENLHTGLTNSWTCSNSAHMNHQAKLCLEAAVNVGVKLDLAITCRRTYSAGPHRISADPPLWLYVQTNSMKATQASVVDDGPLPGPLAKELHHPNNGEIESSMKADSTVFHSLKRAAKEIVSKKRVRFGADEHHDPATSSVEPPQEKQSLTWNSEELCHSTFDIGKATHGMCNHFLDTISHQPERRKDSCLGFLETPNFCKLVFYDSGKRIPYRGHSEDTITISQILPSLRRSQQLDLALNISIAVLRYHTTSWLPADWHLHDLAFFGKHCTMSSNEFLDQLKTLHLSAEFPGHNDHLLQETVPQVKADTLLHSSSGADLYGIRNLTLANLGIALLEIGLRKDIQEFRKTCEPHDVVTARKLANGLQTPLGPQYQAIIRKCVDCDFAFGADLSTRELQDAVYSDVVCSLKDLIKAFEGLGLE